MITAGGAAFRAALVSEGLLLPQTRPLGPAEAIGRAKVLLTRATSCATPAASSLHLEPITTEAGWSAYERARVEVEAGFGVGADRTHELVAALRARCDRLSMGLFWTTDPGTGAAVGAVGRYRLPAPFSAWARLQEVDVFPGWRGRGHGDALLAAVLDLVAGEGATSVVVGADEDDWPLSWYRRRGFRDAVRVPPLAS